MTCRLRKLFSIIFLVCFSSVMLGADLTPQQQTEVRMLINLMDYIAKDYRMAVSDRDVINDFEFAEMQEFSGNALDYFLALEQGGVLTDVSAEHDALVSLSALIASKAPPAAVSAQAASIRAAIVALKLVV